MYTRHEPWIGWDSRLWTLYPARGHNVPAALSQILSTTRCNESQDAPLLIHKESSYEIFIHDTNVNESIVPTRNDVGTLQHFLLLVEFHQKYKLEIKNLKVQWFWRFWITKSRGKIVQNTWFLYLVFGV